MNAASLGTFPVLLKREYWEHRGGFLWAPIIAGAIMLVLTVMAWVAAEVITGRTDFNIGGINIGDLTRNADAKDWRELGAALDLSQLLAAGWPLIVLAFVTFFYSLGALYDERKDRSVLFWKSLPVSDAQTVWSKVASALVVAPLIAIAIGVVTGLGFVLILGLIAAVHGGNPLTVVWGPASPLNVAFTLIASLPIYALWALPTVGWLLLCSAWARSKPFLWAVLIPVFAGILVSWFDLMKMLNLGAGWFWAHVVGRLLLGTVPAMDLPYRNDLAEFASASNSPESTLWLLSAQNAYASLQMPEIWIGAAAGVAMILVATRLRRWRDDG